MDDVTNIRDVASLCVDYDRYKNEIISHIHISYFNVNQISYLKDIVNCISKNVL
jgi:hypothetical protein